ncbi:hypothetical protein O6H91_08G045900 [Diphasiastrum complanatum]|uniref:Uncharacterized protein n=1 Tax=Diphasiastrum complanatum TaxID=34168 RepID=A0ACC2CX82_DIPCM|nr:hypothetical protein O6H91_08G045900 [Diphasiastrum complanatum]
MNGRKVSKVKSILRKWHSFAHNGKAYASLECNSPSRGRTSLRTKSCEYVEDRRSFASEGDVPDGFLQVYVGRDQRRYVISDRYLKHPVFRSLMQKSGVSLDEKDGIKFPCEVVLFDHLLWMLENDDPAVRQADSVDELVEFYAC